MNPVIEKLLILQDRDKRLLELKSALARVPAERTALAEREGALAAGVEEARDAMRHAEADRKKAELEAAAKQAQVQKYKTQLLEIKNNDQFHALQHEIAATEAEIRQIEDREIGFMELVETLQHKVKAAENLQKESAGQILLQKKDLATREAAMNVEIEGLVKERTALAADLEEETRARYERIFAHRNGQAVVAVAHGMCSGCHLKLTTQAIHDALRDDALVTCINCGRLLFHARGDP